MDKVSITMTVNGAPVLMLTGIVKSVVAGTLGLVGLPGAIGPVREFVDTVWLTPTIRPSMIWVNGGLAVAPVLKSS